MKKTKTRRTLRIHDIPVELYDADGDVAVKELTRLFNKIWREEKVPDQWKKGLIVNTKKRKFEGVPEELAWRDIVTCG